MLGGYAGNILYVDLGKGSVKREPLNIGLARDFIGGWGINARLAYDLIIRGISPFSPECPLIFGAGFLTGTLSPSTPKIFLTSKCPASGAVATAVGSGYFASELKWAGYDHLVITGRAEKPVYLKIVDDDIEICDASHVWGKDLFEATDELRDRHGDASSIACIGTAGENLVNIAIIILDKMSTCGRSFGANMGAKNLKAVVVKGSKGIKISRPKRFTKIVNELIRRGMNDPNRGNWTKLGLYHILPHWAKAGHFIYRNQRETFPEEEAIELYGPDRYLEVKRSTLGCPACLACDKAVIELKEGEFAGLVTTVSTPMVPAMTFGMSCQVGSLSRVYKCGDLANRYGIDIMTFGNLFNFAVELYQRGVITREDTEGLELRSDFKTLMRLLEMTANREGFGEVLAEGISGAIKRIGKESERYAYHIKGGAPDFDARVSFGVETLGAVTNPRPAHDLPVGGLNIAKGRKPEFFERLAVGMGFSQEVVDSIFSPQGFDLGRFQVHYEHWATVLDMFGICFRMQSSRLYTAQIVAELYSAATGRERSSSEIIEAAERAYNVYKVVNVREGFSRKDDTFPNRWFEPLRRKDRGEELYMADYFGGKPITREDAESILDTYYEERGWEVERGIPARKKLIQLGLKDIADRMDEWLN